MKSMIRDREHLKNIRQCPCIKCGSLQEIQAAHIRANGDGGMGIKPSDNRVVPLCYYCHDIQHRKGEVTFWGGMDKVFDAIEVALSLYPLGLHAMRQKVIRARKDLF